MTFTSAVDTEIYGHRFPAAGGHKWRIAAGYRNAPDSGRRAPAASNVHAAPTLTASNESRSQPGLTGAPDLGLRLGQVCAYPRSEAASGSAPSPGRRTLPTVSVSPRRKRGPAPSETPGLKTLNRTKA